MARTINTIPMMLMDRLMVMPITMPTTTRIITIMTMNTTMTMTMPKTAPFIMAKALQVCMFRA